MTSHTQIPSAAKLARDTREQLAEIRVFLLTHADKHRGDKTMSHDIDRAQHHLIKAFRGVNSLLSLAKTYSETE